MGLLGDFLQSASNTAASNVSAPIDGLAWLLRKAGVNVDEPIGGSDWMQRQGFTRPVQQSGATLAGDTMGLLSPMLVAAKAPKIASGLLNMGENAAIPQKLNKESGVLLFHGSSGKDPIKKINDEGLFGGLFASPSKRIAESHGDAVYRMTVPDEKIMNVGDELPWDHVTNIVGKNVKKGSPHVDEIADMVVNAKSAYNSQIPEVELLSALRSSDMAEADWEIQRLRGLLGKSAGYKAVQMPDEHGMSYLILPGTSARPHNQTAKQLFRKKMD